MTIDPRETPQYMDLSSAHSSLERVMIVLDPSRPTTLTKSFQDDADNRNITLEKLLSEVIQVSMDRIAHWIPCRFEGIPQCECDCPDCFPETETNR
jgi:hypothetical protein